MEVQISPYNPGGHYVFEILLKWDSSYEKAYALLTRGEMRQLADALIAFELDLQEREHQEGKA